jgi:hypothetical protein
MKKLIKYLETRIKKDYEFIVGDCLKYFSNNEIIYCKVVEQRVTESEYYLSLIPIKENHIRTISIFDAKYSHNRRMIRL